MFTLCLFEKEVLKLNFCCTYREYTVGCQVQYVFMMRKTRDFTEFSSCIATRLLAVCVLHYYIFEFFSPCQVTQVRKIRLYRCRRHWSLNLIPAPGFPLSSRSDRWKSYWSFFTLFETNSPPQYCSRAICLD